MQDPSWFPRPVYLLSFPPRALFFLLKPLRHAAVQETHPAEAHDRDQSTAVDPELDNFFERCTPAAFVHDFVTVGGLFAGASSCFLFLLVPAKPRGFTHEIVFHGRTPGAVSLISCFERQQI